MLSRSRSRLNALARRLLQKTGHELHRIRPVELEVEAFTSPADAIYHHGDPIFGLPIEACYYPYVFSYSPTGWHPFVLTVRELAEDAGVSYRDTSLYRYYSRFQPPNVRQLLFEAGADGSGAEQLDQYSLDEYLPVLPWDPAVFKARGEKGFSPQSGNQGYGPVTHEKGALELRRLAHALDSIANTGYRPSEHGNGEIRGYFLKTPDAYRFVIRAGLHRVAVLSYLGYETIRVGFFPRFPRAIHSADVCSWPLVNRGLYTAEAAARYLKRFFEEDGRLKASRLGLL